MATWEQHEIRIEALERRLDAQASEAILRSIRELEQRIMAIIDTLNTSLDGLKASIDSYIAAKGTGGGTSDALVSAANDRVTALQAEVDAAKAALSPPAPAPAPTTIAQALGART